MNWNNTDFIHRIPKTDLHVHLDGSLRLKTLLELSSDLNISLPGQNEEELKEKVFKEKYASLEEYLKGFYYTGLVMRSPENLERIAFELAEDNWLEGVRYLEVRFAPQLHMSKELSFRDVVEAVDKGLKRAKAQFNHHLPNEEPGFEYGIILCAMRYFNGSFSPYYKSLFEVLPFSSEKQIIHRASLELARGATKLKEETNIQIVGFDLAGAEYGYPASGHQRSYDHIHKNFLNKTVHAGEAYGPSSIFQAVTDLHADRIGHALHLFDEEMLDPSIENPEAYLQGLQQYIANHRTTIEVCLTSNMQTSPHLKSLQDHSLKRMLDEKLSITLCTDNRLVSHTSVTKEILLALNHFDITPSHLKNIIIYGFKRSFFYGGYKEKREYVRKAINYYESLEKEYNILNT
ncbi:adenosine deaminase family protein [Spirochaeta cellobiosiphila]|uniref:adenosine deaminase family protein n=1 Tax=Spirochaeta cellobiosiphila TaxID=504483 RepID=UPI0003F535E8|nr:adenosine deaminase family protein [Spirochaeta cellobiosiphila]